MRRDLGSLLLSSPGLTRRSATRAAGAPLRLEQRRPGPCAIGFDLAQAAERQAMVLDCHLSYPGRAKRGPVNLSLTIGRYGVPARRSMRSWESVRLRAEQRQGFLRSHGPAKGGVDRTRVKLRLMPRSPGRPPDSAIGLASFRFMAKISRAALGLPRVSTAQFGEVTAQPQPGIAGSSPAMGRGRNYGVPHPTMGGARPPHRFESDPGLITPREGSHRVSASGDRA